MKHCRNIAIMFALAFLAIGPSYSQEWKTILDQRLPEYGHRNWIVIADAAYPNQSSQGIETVFTNADQLDVLKFVLESVEAAPHVRPIIMFDLELESLSEASALGVKSYKSGLNILFGKRSFKAMPHDEIIHKLDEESKLFNVLVLKTKMTIPYTSVFIQLDCGYWSAEQEKQLRVLIGKKNGK